MLASAAMRRFLAPLLAALALSGTALAVGPKKVNEYKAPDLTDEEREAQAQSRKNKVHTWTDDTLEPERPFPWMFVGLAGLAFLTAIPFAVKAYRQSSDELGAIGEANAAQTPQPTGAPPPPPRRRPPPPPPRS